MRSDIVPGGVFPDYELPDHTRTMRRLSELQGDDPLILTLARGHYCPKEHQQHLQLAAFYPQIGVAYTQIATISTDDHHASQEFRASVGAQWPFLSDPGRTVQQDLEIQEYTDPEHDPMIPHTLVLKPGLVIHSVYNGYGSGAALRSRTCATTCVPSRVRSALTGICAHPDFARPGRPATAHRSTAGTGGARNASRPSLSALRAEHVLVPTTPGRC
jgi:peroxiredoxin